MLNDLHAAAFLQLSRLWRRQHGTVTDADFFLKGLSSLLFLPQPSLGKQQPQDTPHAEGCNAQEAQTFPV